MTCPLCGTRKARRGCPALGRQICAVCCDTKRLVQIQCPSDCAWLASAREHPPAVIVRRRQRDLGVVAHFLRDLGERQSRLLFLILSVIARYEPPELQSIVDDDVAEATSAMASTYETASRGVIYEHRPASLTAERLVTALKPVIVEAGQNGGSAFERDAAFVLRRIAEIVGKVRETEPGNRRAFFELVGRVIRKEAGDADPAEDARRGGPPGDTPGDASRLILP